MTSTSQERETLSVTKLERLSVQARRLIVQSIYTAGAGHLGGPLSATDLLVALYFNALRIDPERPDWPERDRFILSKGHSSIALYTVLAMRGYFPIEELDTFDQIDSRLQGHPDLTRLTGLDMSTGSLGQGLSPGLGMALAARAKGLDFRTWVMLGDGELQEGQIWEAAFVAARYQVDSLVAIVDLNGLPQYGWPDSSGHTRSIPFGDPAPIFAGFGWRVLHCDGHDHAAIAKALADAQERTGKPTVIVAETVKGKGISFMEHQHLWHAKPPTDEELAQAMSELDRIEATLDAEGAYV